MKKILKFKLIFAFGLSFALLSNKGCQKQGDNNQHQVVLSDFTFDDKGFTRSISSIEQDYGNTDLYTVNNDCESIQYTDYDLFSFGKNEDALQFKLMGVRLGYQDSKIIKHKNFTINGATTSDILSYFGSNARITQEVDNKITELVIDLSNIDGSLVFTFIQNYPSEYKYWAPC